MMQKYYVASKSHVLNVLYFGTLFETNVYEVAMIWDNVLFHFVYIYIYIFNNRKIGGMCMTHYVYSGSLH